MKPLTAIPWILLTFIGIVSLAGFAAPQDDTVPVGTIMAWAGVKDSIPANWMVCDGKALKVNQYEDLFNAIGWSWGKPGGKKFNLPDLRGRFMRGVDDGVDLDPDADNREVSRKGGNDKGIGSVQGDAVQEHSHYQLEHGHSYARAYQTLAIQDTAGTTTLYRYGLLITTTGTAQPAISGAIKYKNHAAINLSEETRPKNAGVYFIIKVK